MTAIKLGDTVEVLDSGNSEGVGQVVWEQTGWDGRQYLMVEVLRRGGRVLRLASAPGPLPEVPAEVTSERLAIEGTAADVERFRRILAQQYERHPAGLYDPE